MIASTARHVAHVNLHRLSGRIDTRAAETQTGEIELADIVGRVGGGDAFAAGVLHSFETGHDITAAAHTGIALAALKHSIPGDAALFHQNDIDAFLHGGLDVRR